MVGYLRENISFTSQGCIYIECTTFQRKKKLSNNGNGGESKSTSINYKSNTHAPKRK